MELISILFEYLWKSLGVLFLLTIWLVLSQIIFFKILEFIKAYKNADISDGD